MDELRERTRDKLARAVKAEMEHAPLDKITVTQIVERAGRDPADLLPQLPGQVRPGELAL